MKRTTYQHPELRDANDNIIQQGAFGKNTALANSTNDGWIDYVANDLEVLYDAQTAADTSISTETLTVSGKTTTGTLEASSATVSGQTTTGTLAAGDTTVTGSITTTGLTVTGATSVPTANEGDSSKTIANTEFVTAKAGNYLPLSGGTMTGSIQYVDNGKVFAIGHTAAGNVDLGWNFVNKEGAGIGLRSTDYASSPGEFTLFARDANNFSSLTGKPDGSLTWNNQPLLPVGIVQAFAGSTIPQGWLLCDGSAVSRTTYAKLFSVIGTTYGAGNGSTTFNLPNLVDRFVEGSATAGTVKSAGLPNIHGWANIAFPSGKVLVSGCFTSTWKNGNVAANSSGGVFGNLTFNASDSNNIYGNSTTVQPPALTMRYIIKY